MFIKNKIDNLKRRKGVQFTFSVKIKSFYKSNTSLDVNMSMCESLVTVEEGLRSGDGRMAVWRWSGCGQVAIRWQSGGGRAAVGWQLSGGRVTVRWRSGGGPVSVG